MAKHDSPTPEAVMTQADDFKLIHGIGPGIEARLHAAGIRTYAQLASLTPDEVVAALGNVIGLTVKRVVDQDWVAQARKRIPAKRTGHVNGKAGRQHYATFAVELLLDESNDVRRTHVVNIQSEAEDTWAGWDEKRLVEFVVQHAELKEQPAGASRAGPDAPQEHLQAAQEASLPAQPVGLGGSVHLSELWVTSAGTGQRSRILPKYRPFEIKAVLDLSSLVLPGDGPVDYLATVIAKALGRGGHRQVGEARGVLKQARSDEFTFRSGELDAGIYRLQIGLTLTMQPVEPGAKPQFMEVMLDGGLLQIY